MGLEGTSEVALGAGIIAHVFFSELSLSHASFWLLLTHRGQVGGLGPLAFWGGDVMWLQG